MCERTFLWVRREPRECRFANQAEGQLAYRTLCASRSPPIAVPASDLRT